MHSFFSFSPPGAPGSLQGCLPGCAEAEAGAPAWILPQGLVSRAGRAGGITGGLAGAGTERAGAVPFTTADARKKDSAS